MCKIEGLVQNEIFTGDISFLKRESFSTIRSKALYGSWITPWNVSVTFLRPKTFRNCQERWEWSGKQNIYCFKTESVNGKF